MTDNSPISTLETLRVVEVLIPSPLNRTYSYLVPDDLPIPELGSFVEVAFGPRPVIGIVWGLASDITPAIQAKLKPLREVLRWQPVPEPLRRLAQRTAAYSLTPIGVLARALMPPSDFDRPERVQYKLTPITPRPKVRMTPAREKVLSVWERLENKSASLPQSYVREQAPASPAVINSMVENGLLDRSAIEVAETIGEARAPILNEMQARAAERLSEYLGAGFKPILLQGVTGSGKTEVYFDMLGRALDNGERVLVLLPEIALTTDWIDRFFARFGFMPTVWHSEVGGLGKRRAFKDILSGKAKVLVGARSSLWQPLRGLGLVIVDEEHDGSFKQEDNGSFNARDMAILRAQEENCPIVLASATPSIETRENAEKGRYAHVQMLERFSEVGLPEVKLVDLREQDLSAERFISPFVAERVSETLAAGQQVLFFLNRRGYAPLTLCRTCGHRFACGNCSAWLVQHRLRGVLSCHHCGQEQRLPKDCPSCEQPGPFAACGPGVERLHDEVINLFPQARVGVAVSDGFSGPREIVEFLDAAKSGALNLLIGTQILAKGQNLPFLKMVVVVDADLGLTGGDPRAAERTFQLLTQVAGRAGRFDQKGEVYLQTSQPDDPLFRPICDGDYEAFYHAERARREQVALPPFGRLASVILSHTNEQKLRELSAEIGQAIPQGEDFAIFGPAPAPIYQLRGRFRQRFIVRTKKTTNIQRLLTAWLAPIKLPSQTRLSIDIDPYSFM